MNNAVAKLGTGAGSASVAKLPDVLQLAQEFIEAQDVAPVSRDVYRRALRQFLNWIRAEQITNPDRQTVLNYKRHLEESGSPYTVSAYLTAVRGFFAYLEGRRLYPNIAAGIRGARKPAGGAKDPLTLDQTKTLLQSIDRSTLQGKRDFALLNLLVSTGLRTVEVIRADLGDMRQEGGEVVLWIQGKGKSAKDEPVLLTPEVSGPLYEYSGLRGDTGPAAPLFTSLSGRNLGGRLTTRSLSRVVKTRLQAIGINSRRITAHSLRHTAITSYIKASGGDLMGAQTLARHADPRTTQVYIKRLNRITDAPERTLSEALQAAGCYDNQ